MRFDNTSLRLAARLSIFVCGCIAFLLAGHADAQVFGPGPSDSLLFDSVINLPEDQAGISGVVGGGQTTQVNVNEGGVVAAFTRFDSGSELNVRGGTLAPIVIANDGSEVNIISGVVARGVQARAGSKVSVRGGRLGPGFTAQPGSDFELVGEGFRLSGVEVVGDSVTLERGQVLSGTLADGSVFIFDDSTVFLESVTLARPSVPIPPAELSPRVISTPLVGGPSGLRAGQTLTLQSGGEIPVHYAVVGGTLNVEGGVVRDGLEVVDGRVNIKGGEVVGSIDSFTAFQGSLVEIGGGSVEQLVQFSGSQLRVSGGGLGFLTAVSGAVTDVSGGNVRSINSLGSHVNISGGSVRGLGVTSGSVVNASGGVLPDFLNVSAGGEFNLFGTEFQLDGEVLGGLEVGNAFTVIERGEAVLSGLLADGTPFSFELNPVDPSPSEDRISPSEFFDPEATLTVTLVNPAGVPEPSALLLAIAGFSLSISGRNHAACLAAC